MKKSKNSNCSSNELLYCKPVLADQFNSLFDEDGKILKEDEFFASIFFGGCSPDIRHKVWPFLFNVYPLDSTFHKRESIDIENHYRYHALKNRCEMFMEGWNNDLLDLQSKTKSEVIAVPVYKNFQLKQRTDSELKTVECLAKIYAFSRRADCNNVFKWNKIIEKDIPRTDFSHPKLADKSHEIQVKMKNILTTFGFFHCDTGYVQGMNEILLNFLVVFEHESDAYWCFSNYMTSVKSDFDEVGMLEKVQLVQTVLHKVEPNLSCHLQNCNVKDLVFCHRCLLLRFKRDFQYENGLRFFEIVEAEMRCRNFEIKKWLKASPMYKNLLEEAGIEKLLINLTKDNFTFDVFLCVVLIMMSQHHFLSCTEAHEVFKVANNCFSILSFFDFHFFHEKSIELFHRYLKLFFDDYIKSKSNQSLSGLMSNLLKLNWK